MCSCDRLRSNSELDVVVVCIYQNWPITAVPSWAKGKTPFNTRRSYFAPIIKAKTRHLNRSAFMVEAPGTAPGSAIPSKCAVYRHSWQASPLYIEDNDGDEKA